MLRALPIENLHNSIVAARAMELSRAGESVWADVDGYLQPQMVFGHRPDIIANGSQNLICEVETADTYSSTHTRDQLTAFDSVKNYLLEMVVPESVYDAARMLYPVIWRISVDRWRTFKG